MPVYPTEFELTKVSKARRCSSRPILTLNRSGQLGWIQFIVGKSTSRWQWSSAKPVMGPSFSVPRRMDMMTYYPIKKD